MYFYLYFFGQVERSWSMVKAFIKYVTSYGLGLYLCCTKTREVLGNPSPTPERFPEGKARGKSRGSREIWRAEGMDLPIPPEFWWSTDNLSASIFLQGVDQEILPCGQGRIDSVKINPSLLMMRDCKMAIWGTFGFYN